MSKTIKNVKLTTRQHQLLQDALILLETNLDDMIQDGWDGYSEKTQQVLDNLCDKLGVFR